MSRDYSSISRFGLTEPFNLQVARGQIAYHESVYKFGNNAAVGDSLETIWQQGGLYSYLSAATVLRFPVAPLMTLRRAREPEPLSCLDLMAITTKYQRLSP